MSFDKPNWWVDQVRLGKNEGNIDFIMYVMAQVANHEVLERLKQEFAEWTPLADGGMRSKIINGVRLILEEGVEEEGPSEESNTFLSTRLRGSGHIDMFLAIWIRAHPYHQRVSLISHVHKFISSCEPAAYGLILSALNEGASLSQLSWEDAVALSRRMFLPGIISNVFRPEPVGKNMPMDVALNVLKEPRELPLFIVALADEIVRADYARSQPTMRDFATSHNWFKGQVV